MAAYIAQRIIDEAVSYTEAVTKRPDLKEGIDAYLWEHGREGLIVS